jgi:hypothetical protein
VIQDGLSRATYPALVSGHQNRNGAKGAISTNMPGYTHTIYHDHKLFLLAFLASCFTF